MMAWWKKLLVCGAALWGLWAAAPVLGQEPQPLRLGVIGPFTGPAADFGVAMRHGIELAVQEINAVGGYLGRPIELIVMDDEGQPEVGRRRAEELANAGVLATLGFCNTGVALNAIDIFQNRQIPLIIPCSTGTPLTQRFAAPGSYIFRSSGSDEVMAAFMVDELVRRDWTRVAVFADTTPYGESGLKDVQTALASHGLKPVYVARFPMGVTDLRKELGEARAVGANAIFSITLGRENAVLAIGRRELGWNAPLVGGPPLSFPFFIDGAGAAAEGALMAQTFIAEPRNTRHIAFLGAYTRKFGQPPRVPTASAHAYDSMYLLMYALFAIRDGNPTGPALKQALENIPRVYAGVVGTFDRPWSIDNKEAITRNMVVMGKVVNGRVTFADPEDARRRAWVQRNR